MADRLNNVETQWNLEIEKRICEGRGEQKTENPMCKNELLNT